MSAGRTAYVGLWMMTLLFAGCGHSGPGSEASGAAAPASVTSLPPKPAPQPTAVGVTAANIRVTPKPSLAGHGKELELTGDIINESSQSVEGVNLVITFANATGATVGGHSTQQYFQPALAAGSKQSFVIRVPAVGGTLDSAAQATVKVANTIKAGDSSPDGWKPLDPKNLPAGKVVKQKTVSETGKAG